jgi:hypothetical protein
MREGGVARRAHKTHTTHEKPKGVHVTHSLGPQAMPNTMVARKNAAWAGEGNAPLFGGVGEDDHRLRQNTAAFFWCTVGTCPANQGKVRACPALRLPGLTIAPGVSGFQSCEFGPAASGIDMRCDDAQPWAPFR